MKEINSDVTTRFNAKAKDEAVGYIYRSYNYKQFKLSKVNRAISDQHVDDIVKAIRNQQVKLPIIQVNPRFEIIDGQHRFKALVKLGLPIYYYIDRQSDDESIIQINSKQTRWHLPQFIHARAAQGYPGYEELLNLTQKYNSLAAPSSIVAIFSGSEDWKGGSMTKTVQDGDFKFGDKDKAIKFLEKITDAKKHLQKKRQLNNGLVRALWAYYNRPEVNQDKLMNLITDDFVARSPRNRNALMAFVGERYNKSSRKKVKFSMDFKGNFRFDEE